ncbi:MAG: TetR family transcriptional regulator, partial [Acidobacteria bacterium]
STLKLLQEMGFPDLSIEAIAADADVGKATVYRWWPNKASLVAEAFSRSADEELRFPNTGSVRNDVSIQMKHLVRILRGRRGRIVAALIGGGQSDPELIQAFRDRFMMPRRQEAYQTLRRGMARRELPEHVDLDLALDILYGSLYMRFLIRQTGLTEDYVEQVVALVFDGAAKRE